MLRCYGFGRESDVVEAVVLQLRGSHFGARSRNRSCPNRYSTRPCRPIGLRDLELSLVAPFEFDDRKVHVASAVVPIAVCTEAAGAALGCIGSFPAIGELSVSDYDSSGFRLVDAYAGWMLRSFPSN
jgi:hypothetical protein